MNDPVKINGSRKAGKCPYCGAPADAEAYRPFCSRKCANLDLLNWLGEGYRIPTEEEPDPGMDLPTGEGG